MLSSIYWLVLVEYGSLSQRQRNIAMAIEDLFAMILTWILLSWCRKFA
jgi:predicted nucleic acid-binding Zn ribbon protein